MLPLHDDNPTLRKPVVTVGLILACVAMFLWQQTLTGGFAERVIYGMGMVPALVLGGYDLPPGMGLVPAWASPVTYQFLHGGWMHLIGNMMFLWVFGNNVEDRLGHGRYLVFYLLCGVLAGLGQAAIDPASPIPTIGASGAVSGILGAYLVTWPNARVLVVVPVMVIPWPIRIPALIVLGLWFLFQFANATGGTASGVAFWAHVVGFVAGMLLMFPFRLGTRPPAPVAAPGAVSDVPPRRPRRRGIIPDSEG